MSSIINASINLSKIDKSKIVDGKKGKYLNITVGANRDGEDQYGNTHYVFQSQSKEERENKTDKNYLGNGKEFVFENDNSSTESSKDDDDLPF